MGKLGMAIVGCGWAGEKHFQALKQLSDRAVVKALVDNDAEFLEKTARNWGIGDTFTDYRAILDRDDIDAVSLCLPHDAHAEAAVQCARAGKHILCEKPMAVSLKQADAMLSAVEKSGVKLMVAESALFQADTRRVKELLDSGLIGNPVLIRAVFMPGRPSKTGYVYPGRRAWLSDRGVAGGGQWLLNGIHRVSILRLFFGEIGSIFAAEYGTPDFDLNIEANVCATLKFVSGTLGQLVFGVQTANYGVFDPLMIHGDEGAIVLKCSDDRIHVYGENAGCPGAHRVIDRDDGADHFVLELEHFLDYVQHDAPCICSGAAERASLAVIEAGFESMRTGRAVACNTRSTKV